MPPSLLVKTATQQLPSLLHPGQVPHSVTVFFPGTLSGKAKVLNNGFHKVHAVCHSDVPPNPPPGSLSSPPRPPSLYVSHLGPWSSEPSSCNSFKAFAICPLLHRLTSVRIVGHVNPFQSPNVTALFKNACCAPLTAPLVPRALLSGSFFPFHLFYDCCHLCCVPSLENKLCEGKDVCFLHWSVLSTQGSIWHIVGALQLFEWPIGSWVRKTENSTYKEHHFCDMWWISVGACIYTDRRYTQLRGCKQTTQPTH